MGEYAHGGQLALERAEVAINGCQPDRHAWFLYVAISFASPRNSPSFTLKTLRPHNVRSPP